MEKQPDKYDEAIAFLTENPNEITTAWNYPNSHPGGCLFVYTGDGYGKSPCGCLTQVRHNGHQAKTRKLTKAILADDRIPTANEITVESLPVFAEWQRRIDKELGRV